MNLNPYDAAELASFGAPLVGLVVGSVLTGCTFVQSYIYFKTESGESDPSWLRALVLFLAAFDVTQLAFHTAFVYEGLIYNYGRPQWFMAGSWTFLVSAAMNIALSTIVQMFYVRRIFILISGNSRILETPCKVLAIPLFITIMCLVSPVTALVSAIRVIQNHDFVHLYKELLDVDLALGATVAADIMIVCTLSYQILRLKGGLKETDAMLDKLLVWTVNTGFLPTIFELLHLIFVSIPSQHFIHMSFALIAPRLYVNSLLATLNARILVFRGSAVLGSQLSLPDGSTRTNGLPSMQFRPVRVTQQVRVSTDCEADIEGRTHDEPRREHSERGRSLTSSSLSDIRIDNKLKEISPTRSRRSF